MTTELDSNPKNLWFFGIKLVACLLADQDQPSDKDVNEAIQVMNRMLTVFTREKQPKYWAHVHLQLGRAVRDPKEALLHYEKALEVFTKEKHPEDWALAKKAAGEVYYHLADSIPELNKSLDYHRDALTVFTPEKYPDEGLVEAIEMIESAIAKAGSRST